MTHSILALGLLTGLLGGCLSSTLADDDDGSDDDDSNVSDDDSAADDDDSGGDEDGDNDGYSVADGDCDDGNPLRNPGATEQCSGVDEDCDGLIDEDTSVVALPPGSYGLSEATASLVGPSGELLGFYMHDIGDTDGDGLDDLLVPSLLQNRLLLGPFCSRAYGVEEAVATFETRDGGFASTYLGDVNGDGLDDTRLQGSIFLAPFLGEYTAASADLTIDWGTATSMQAGDLNGDGTPDLAVGHYGRDQVVFFPGPLSGPVLDSSTAATVTAPGRFGEFLTILEGIQPPTTLIGAGWDLDGGSVYVVEGLPQPGTLFTPAERLPTAALFQGAGTRRGSGLGSNRDTRACIGTGDGTPGGEVVCGSLDNLRAGTADERFFGVDDPGASAGPWMSLQGAVQAAGNPGAKIDELLYAGSVEVRGPTGTWTIVNDTGTCCLGWGKGLALLKDPTRGLTWLAVGAPGYDSAAGAVFLFALDIPPT